MIIKKRSREGGEFSTASMADITFLLLLFFLVSTNIDVDTGIGLTLPEITDITNVAPLSKERLAAILINESGDVLLNKEIISIPQIRENLRARIRSKIDLPKNKKLVVSIKTDRNTNYNLYIQALDAIKGAYFDVRDEYALNHWGIKTHNPEKLTKQQFNELKEKIPIIISIAEPEKIK